MFIDPADTLGHADFAAEAEGGAGPDYAVGGDKRQRRGPGAYGDALAALERYNVPAFIFVTKMDVSSRTRSDISWPSSALFRRGCADFTQPTLRTSLACSEEALELCCPVDALPTAR